MDKVKWVTIYAPESRFLIAKERRILNLEQVFQLLSNAGLIGEIKQDGNTGFRFIALSRRAADSSGNAAVPDRLPCIVYLHGPQCIVSIELAAIIAMSHDASVIVQTIQDWWDTYSQLRDYPLYRAIYAIKQAGYAAFFEDRNIYIYELDDEKRVMDVIEKERQIEQFDNSDKEKSCAVFELQEDSWAYSSSVTNTHISNLSLEQCVEVFKDEINKHG